MRSKLPAPSSGTARILPQTRARSPPASIRSAETQAAQSGSAAEASTLETSPSLAVESRSPGCSRACPESPPSALRTLAPAAHPHPQSTAPDAAPPAPAPSMHAACRSSSAARPAPAPAAPAHPLLPAQAQARLCRRSSRRPSPQLQTLRHGWQAPPAPPPQSRALHPAPESAPTPRAGNPHPHPAAVGTRAGL